MQDKKPRNEQGQKHGQWERYHFNGKLWYKVNFINGKLYGCLEVYYFSGNLNYQHYHAR